MLLTTLSLFHVVMALCVRDERGTIFNREAMPHGRQLRLIGMALLLTFLATELGFLQRIFSTVSLTPQRVARLHWRCAEPAGGRRSDQVLPRSPHQAARTVRSHAGDAAAQSAGRLSSDDGTMQEEVNGATSDEEGQEAEDDRPLPSSQRGSRWQPAADDGARSSSKSWNRFRSSWSSSRSG